VGIDDYLIVMAWVSERSLLEKRETSDMTWFLRFCVGKQQLPVHEGRKYLEALTNGNEITVEAESRT
jgi:hypothetical protein